MYDPYLKYRPVSREWLDRPDREVDFESAMAAHVYIRRTSRIVDGAPVSFVERSADLAACGILTPAHAPSWTQNVEAVWMFADLAAAQSKNPAEIRAHHVILGLPPGEEEEVSLARLRAFVCEHLTSNGVVVDYAIHVPARAGRAERPHIHLLISAREITATGFGRKHGMLLDRAAHDRLRAAWKQACGVGLTAHEEALLSDRKGEPARAPALRDQLEKLFGR